MATHSEYLAGLTLEDRTALEGRLLERQSGKCFICDDTIDPVLHQDQLDVDHTVPLAEQGADDEHNFALTHASCNRSKGASDRRCCTARSKSLTSLCRLQSHPAQYVSGIPSAAILLSILHPIRCSTRCLANVRARISGPMSAL